MDKKQKRNKRPTKKIRKKINEFIHFVLPQLRMWTHGDLSFQWFAPRTEPKGCASVGWARYPVLRALRHGCRRYRQTERSICYLGLWNKWLGHAKQYGLNLRPLSKENYSFRSRLLPVITQRSQIARSKNGRNIVVAI